MIACTVRTAAAIAVSIAAAALVGCGGDAPANEPEPAAVVSADSGPVSAELRVPRVSIGVADRVRAEIRWSAGDGGWTIDPPENAAFEGAGWTVVARTPLVERIEAGRTVGGLDLTLEPFLPGTYWVGPVSIAAENTDGVRRRVALERVKVEVSSALEAAPDADDPALGTLAEPPAGGHESTNFRGVGVVAVVAVVAIAAAVVVAIAVRRRSRGGDGADAEALIDAAERAIAVVRDADAGARSVREAAGAISGVNLVSGSPREVGAALSAIDADGAQKVADALESLDLARFAPAGADPDPARVGTGIAALRELARVAATAQRGAGA